MKVIQLPQDIFPGAAAGSPVLIHDYIAQASVHRDKSILQRHAISLVVSGTKTMHFADRTVHVSDDTIHFLSAGNCVASIDLAPGKIFRSILIFFDQATFDHLLQKNQVVAQPINPFVSVPKDDFIRHYIGSLALLCAGGALHSPAMCLLKLEELFLHLLTTQPEILLSFQGASRPDLEDPAFRKVVETHAQENVRLEDLAFLCNVSLATFKRRFNKVYGQSPGKWLTVQRMQKARALLLQPHLRPGDVYHQVGYADQSSFTEIFRQTYGLTPGAFQAAQFK